MVEQRSTDRTRPHSSRTRELVTASLLAAMIAGTSWVTVPFGPVPVTLQTAFVLLAALLLAPGWAAASMAIYLLIGVAGLPVFAGGVGGIGALLGPTGGFLLAFPIGALVGSAMFRAVTRRHHSAGTVLIAAAGAVVLAECAIYAVGLPWLMWQTGMSLGKAATVALIPFVVPDAVKAAIAVVVAVAVRRAVAQA